MKSTLKNRWFALLLVVLLVVVLIAGTALIASGMWDREEPSVPLSYITDELQPGLMSAVDDAVSKRLASVDQDLNANLEEYQKVVDQKLNSDESFVDAVAEAAAKKMESDLGAGFQKVTLSSGGKLQLSQGTEVLFRSGDAVCSGSTEDSLVDLTDGSTLSDMQALQANHLYLAHMEDRTIIANGDVTLFIRGDYTSSES